MLEAEVKCAEFIQRWTKLELQCWRECLDHCYDKVEANGYKYYFLFYNLVHEYVNAGASGGSESGGSSGTKFDFKDFKSIEKTLSADVNIDAGEPSTTNDADDNESSGITAEDVVNLLNEFIENSNYGEFKLRLQMLKAFELYATGLMVEVHEQQQQQKGTEVKRWERRRTELIAIFHNIYSYFAQFAAGIDDHIKAFRTPIEKKLKEFVKIESYNRDLSYVGLRSNIVKIQKNVHKFFKEFEHCLRVKVKSSMEYKPASVLSKDNTDMAMATGNVAPVRYYVVEPKHFLVEAASIKLSATDAIETVDAFSSTEALLLSNIGKYTAKSRSIVGQIIAKCPMAGRVETLDELLQDEVESCSYLRGLEVDRSQERPKQKSQAKQILRQKKKALADFYDTLKTAGINYNTGCREYELRQALTDFRIAPFCAKSMVNDSKYKRVDQSLHRLNEKLDTYYARAVFKLKTLLNVFQKPNEDMGSDLRRIKGYSVHLFLLVQDQRKQLSTSTKELQSLRTALANVAQLRLCPSDQEHSDSHSIVASMKWAAIETRLFCDQFRSLMRTAPDQLDATFSTSSGGPWDLSQNSSQHAAINRITQKIKSNADAIYDELMRIDSKFIENSIMAKNEQRHRTIVEDLVQLRDIFSTADNDGERHLYYGVVDTFVVNVTGSLSNVRVAEREQEVLSFDEDSFSKRTETVMHNILIAMQKLYKKYAVKIIPAGESADEDGNGDVETGLLQGHIKEHMMEELNTVYSQLNVRQITKQVEKLLLDVQRFGGNALTATALDQFLAIEPLLEQFGYLTEFLLIQESGAHQACAKLLNVMLTVFNELGTNGFCVPKDLLTDEEKQKDESGEKSGNGMGLEDGTGDKDVSDRIESEDQLEDAKRPEDYQNREESKDENNKEEKGIEMSEDFDSNLQDVEKKPDEEGDSDSAKEDEEEDPDKQMGETEEGAEKLDDQIWGDEDKNSEDEASDDEEMNDEEGKGSNEEKEGHNDLNSGKNDKQQGEEDQGLEATDDQQPENKEKKQQQPDIDDMKEPEVDEDQVNPYHNELEEPPEPESMDIEDNVNLDGEEVKENDNEEENNPFDIDEMKNQNVADDKEENGEDEEAAGDDDKTSDKDNNADDSDDDDNEEEGDDKKDATVKGPEEEEQAADPENKENDADENGAEADDKKDEDDEESEKKEKKHEENYAESKDKPSAEDNVQSIPEADQPEKGSRDQTDVSKPQQQEQAADPNVDQDTGEDKEGVGQAENRESESGHKGVADVKSAEIRNDQQRDDNVNQSNKKGNTDEERSLAQQTDKDKDKRLKTVDRQQTENNDEPDEADDDAVDQNRRVDEYQHVKEAKQSDKVTIDNATDEQVAEQKPIKHGDEEETDEKPTEDAADDSPMDVDNTEQEDHDTEKMKSEKAESRPSNKKPSDRNKFNDEQHDVDEERDEDALVDGEDVLTMNVARGADTTAHCRMELALDNGSSAVDLDSVQTALSLKRRVDAEVQGRVLVHPDSDDFGTWQMISPKMMASARDLCEQLRLILEPTKCSRLKGDYRSGRRINMKKVGAR